NDELLKTFDKSIEEAWKKLHSILPRWVYIQYESNAKAFKGIEARIKKCDWYDDIKDQFEEMKKSITELCNLRTEVARQVVRRARRRSSYELQTEFHEKKAEHLIEDYQEVEENLPRESAATRLPSSPEDILSNLPFLSPEIQKELQRPDMMEFLAEHVKKHFPPIPEEDEIILQDEDAAPPEEPKLDRDPEVYQEEDIGPFDDSAEMPVFNVDRMRARLIFFVRLVNPVYGYRELDAKFKENGEWYVCGRCLLWKHTKPPGIQVKSKIYTNFMRHLYEMHTPWEDLRIQMITSNPKEFKCPSNLCTYMADSVDAIFDHCLEGECPEKELFLRIHRACIKKRKRDDEAERAARK
ncbi:unnamed protein product, partial [Rhizoctonia solani]